MYAGCRTILATTTSATFSRAAAELAPAGVLLVQPLMNEGGLGGELRVQLGERPEGQLRAAVGPMMRTAGGAALVPGRQRLRVAAGGARSRARGARRARREVLAERGASIVGEGFARLGTRDFTPLVERILASGADVVPSSFVGADLVAFERGLTGRSTCHRPLTCDGGHY